jgi:hypothetical protein
MDNIPVIKPEWLAGITMTQAQKEQWLAALRSGRHKQCIGAMRRGDSYCCLGVFCNVVLDRASCADGWLGEWNDATTWDPKDTGSLDSVQKILAAMNDNGKSFEEIADFIEANIPACDAVKP